MKSHVQVVVIGGGVVGCSVLYHLTKAGWKDVVLVERKELTAGSTWHAAGGFHTLNGDPNVAKLQSYTVNLYKEIEEISGQSCGLHLTGGVMLAGTPERVEWLKMAHARGRYLGMDTELISVKEAREVYPLLDESQFTGALYDPIEGHLDPSGVTHAYAKSARIGGAEIYRHTWVKELTQSPDGTWQVVTDKGTITCEHVVNAGGLWAREVGRMVGLELPVLAMEHMYLLTEPMEAVKEAVAARGGKEIGHAIDFEGEIYTRQEGEGILLGTYERACVPWSERQTPWDFDTELLQPDLDRLAPSLEVGFRHFPALQTAGIKQVVNGPFTFAPDGNPLIGPVRGLTNYWSACGVMAGFSQGGGVGLALSNWMVNGDPGFDVWGMDVARYGEWATVKYTNAKVRENYSRRFRITFPNEELPAARPHRTTPVYDRLIADNAVMGANYGLEHALWFQRKGEAPVEEVSFRRSNAFDVVAEECAAVRQHVGMLEISNFAKYRITGPDARVWLDRIMANRAPQPGRMTLTPMLNPEGRLIGDFTMACLSDEEFYVFGSGIAEAYHMRWFEGQDFGLRVNVVAEGLGLTGFSIAGPKAKDLLAAVSGESTSSNALPFLSFRNMEIGRVPALVGRISFTGDQGYEIWVRPEFQIALYDTLRSAGAEFGLRQFGGHALNALRLEKNWGSWAREYRPIYSPWQAGLDRFVNLKKGDFIGREAALALRESTGADHQLRTFILPDARSDVLGDEPIWQNGKVVGWVTSGGFAHNAGVSVAMGYVKDNPPMDEVTASYEIEIIGEVVPAQLQIDPMFDPTGTHMRA